MISLGRLRALGLGGGLDVRVMRASAWAVIDLAASNALRLLGNLVMTRLLVPEAFGLMAMVTVVHVALLMFTDLGITQSVVRSRRGDEAHFLRVAWTVQVLRSLGIALLVVGSAGLLALLAPLLAPPQSVYADPDLPGLIAVSALTLLLKGLESTNVALADRRLELGRLALLNVAGQVAGLLAMIGLALLSPTVWALLWGGLLGAACTAALTHLLLGGPRMAVAWDREIGAELWSFGRNILGASILGFFANNADRLILGALLDIRSFGFYVIALTWVMLFVTVVEKLAGQIGLATLSEVTRERPDDVPAVLGRFGLMTDAICVGGFLGCLLGGPVLIGLLYPPDYAVSAGFMPLLAVLILTYRFLPLRGILLSRGDSRAFLHAVAIRALATVTLLPAADLAFGITGALVASALAPLAGAPLFVWRTRDVLRAAVRREVLWLAAIPALSLMLLLLHGGAP